MNQERPIKLQLQRQVNKQSLGYLLSGLKANIQVNELNLVECGLDDEDLQKMASRLTEDSGLNCLKLGLNAFTNI